MKEYRKDKRLLIPRDEFEEEASEGLGRLSREEAEADLGELKSRMESRLRRPRAIWIPAAAAVVLLLAASAVVVSLLRVRPGAGPVMAEGETPAAETIVDTAYIAMAGPIEKADYTSGEKTASARFVPPPVPESADEYELLAEADTGNEYLAEEPIVQFTLVRQEKAGEVVVQAVPQMAQYESQARAVNVTREEKKAASGDKGVKKADRLAESIDSAKETVRAAAVNAVTEQETAGQPIVDTSPAPLGGWDEFIKWTAQNIRYPEGIEPRRRQEVQITFIVRCDSTLTDLRVVRSPGEPFTREAFRLLREGPKWAPAVLNGFSQNEEVICIFIFK